MKPGRIYQIRDTRRDCAGVFTRRSRGITWKGVKFRFLHGMGLVHQFSENLTFDAAVIAPDGSGGRTTAAWADCLHVSGCKGRVLVRDSVFSGAHDDAINIHGTYLRIIGRISDRKVRVRFMHPQTFGFMAFNPRNAVPNSAVHRNIRIADNTFDLRNKLAIGAKSTTGLQITGNRILAGKPLENNAWLLTTGCTEVLVDDNPSRARGSGTSGQ